MWPRHCSTLLVASPLTRLNRKRGKALRHRAMILTALLTAAPCAQAGRIEGRLLVVPARGATPGKADGDKSATAAPPVAQRGVADAVVYLERIPEETERKLTKGPWWRRKPKPNLPR